MNDDHVRLVEIVTEDDLKTLRAAALEDSHYPLFPTHAAVRRGEIVGSASVMAIPLVAVWAHSRKLFARRTMELVNLANVMGIEKNGGNPIITMCPRVSPIFPYMEKMGFREFADTTIFLGKKP